MGVLLSLLFALFIGWIAYLLVALADNTPDNRIAKIAGLIVAGVLFFGSVWG